MKLNGNVDDLFTKYAKKWSEIEKAERIIKIEKVEREIDIFQWREIIKNNFQDFIQT